MDSHHCLLSMITENNKREMRRSDKTTSNVMYYRGSNPLSFQQVEFYSIDFYSDFL